MMSARASEPWTYRAGTLCAWSGLAVMWLFWISFVIFLSAPKAVMPVWPLRCRWSYPAAGLGSAGRPCVDWIIWFAALGDGEARLQEMDYGEAADSI
jgi:hypothetical protein